MLSELAELVLFFGNFSGLTLELVVLLRDAIKDIEVMLEDRSGLLQGVIRSDTAIGPDFEDELVVIGDLSNAGVLDGVANETDWGEK